MRIWPFGKSDTPLLQLQTALKEKNFRTEILSDGNILVWWTTPEAREVAVGYIKPNETCFCFDMDHWNDDGVKAVRSIVETLKARGVSITTSPMSNFQLPQPKDARKRDEVTAG